MNFLKWFTWTIIQFNLILKTHFQIRPNLKKRKRKAFILNWKDLHQFILLHRVKRDFKIFKVINILLMKKENSVKHLNQKVWIELQSIKLILERKKLNWMLKWKLKTSQQLLLLNKIFQSKMKLKERLILPMKKSFMKKVLKEMLTEKLFSNSIFEWNLGITYCNQEKLIFFSRKLLKWILKLLFEEIYLLNI